MVAGSARGHELRGALVGGAVAALLLFAMVLGAGQIGSFEALRLIEGVLPGARFLGSTVVAGSLTVLALLLTLVGLSLTSDYDFDERLYVRAGYIQRLAVVELVIGVVLLLAVSFPISELEELQRYYTILYYGLAALMAVTGGLVVSLGLMIGGTLRGLIGIEHPSFDSDLVRVSDEEGIE